MRELRAYVALHGLGSYYQSQVDSLLHPARFKARSAVMVKYRMANIRVIRYA
jgi:hypothetical protein